MDEQQCYEQTIARINKAIDKADGMIGYFPRYQLYLAKGMTELAYSIFESHRVELLEMDASICRKINDPRYF